MLALLASRKAAESSSSDEQDAPVPAPLPVPPAKRQKTARTRLPVPAAKRQKHVDTDELEERQVAQLLGEGAATTRDAAEVAMHACRGDIKAARKWLRANRREPDRTRARKGPVRSAGERRRLVAGSNR